MRMVAAASAVLFLGGCVTTGGGATTRMIITEPAGAVLTIDGAGECETPCTVKLSGPQRARIAKAGFVATTVMLTPGRGDIVIPLELAAPSTDVDTTALPELD
jgi:hypothetical protein